MVDGSVFLYDALYLVLQQGFWLNMSSFTVDFMDMTNVLSVGRMTYPHMAQLELQTDLTFRNNDDEEHHKGISPFLQL